MPGRKLSEEARQEDILRAAYDVAARQGLSALSLRAVAERATVSHGTVLFHFKRREQLVAALLERVLYATAILRVPYDVERLTRPSDKLLEQLRIEMERLSNEARHFRLFLEYWTLGLRSAPIRRSVTAAIAAYRTAWRALCEPVVMPAADSSSPSKNASRQTRFGLADAEGMAAVAVSLVHGCALQAVIDPTGFDIQQHFDAAGRMLEAALSRSQETPAFNVKRRVALSGATR